MSVSDPLVPILDFWGSHGRNNWIKGFIYQKLIWGTNNLRLDFFPDAFGHFGFSAPGPLGWYSNSLIIKARFIKIFQLSNLKYKVQKTINKLQTMHEIQSANKTLVQSVQLENTLDFEYWFPSLGNRVQCSVKGGKEEGESIPFLISFCILNLSVLLDQKPLEKC